MVSDSLSNDDSADEGSERGNRFASPFPYTDIFEKKFPYYLSIGMTEEQYWDRDCCLVKFYREAEEIRRERVNQELWLQGTAGVGDSKQALTYETPKAKEEA